MQQLAVHTSSPLCNTPPTACGSSRPRGAGSNCHLYFCACFSGPTGGSAPSPTPCSSLSMMKSVSWSSDAAQEVSPESMLCYLLLCFPTAPSLAVVSLHPLLLPLDHSHASWLQRNFLFFLVTFPFIIESPCNKVSRLNTLNWQWIASKSHGCLFSLPVCPGWVERETYY